MSETPQSKPDGIELPALIMHAQAIYEDDCRTFGEKNHWAIKSGSILAGLIELQDARAALSAAEQRAESAERAFKLTQEDCRNLTEKVIPNIKREAEQRAEAIGSQWLPIASAPKDRLIDIWIKEDDGGTRWADCYYDSICDEWRTSRPGGKLIWVRARAVTHWMPPPIAPAAIASGAGESGNG